MELPASRCRGNVALPGNHFNFAEMDKELWESLPTDYRQTCTVPKQVVARGLVSRGLTPRRIPCCQGSVSALTQLGRLVGHEPTAIEPGATRFLDNRLTMLLTVCSSPDIRIRRL